MPTNANLEWTEIEESQSQKATAANDAMDVITGALADDVTIAVSDGGSPSDTTLTDTQALQNMVFLLTGTLTANRNVIVPTNKKLYVFVNNTTGGFAVTVKTAAGTGVSVPNGETITMRSDGTNIESVSGGGASTSGSVYDIPMRQVATPGVGDTMLSVMLVRGVTFPADFSGSLGKIGTNPDSSFVMSVKDDGSEIGTVTVSTGGTFTFATTGNAEQTVASGSELTIVAPSGSPAEASAADIRVTLKATVT